jgi:integrase
MATVRMATLWRDPRTSILMLRRRIPTRYRAVSGRRGETVKITTGTADRKLAEKLLPSVLAKWAEMQAEWERKLHVVAVTPERAKEIAASWAAWIAANLDRLDTDGERSTLFATGLEARLAETFERRNEDIKSRRQRTLSRHADDASRLCGVTVSDDTRVVLADAMLPVVAAAYRQAGLKALGVTAGKGRRWNPLAEARAGLPNVPDAPSAVRPDASFPTLPFVALIDGWRRVSASVVKPRTVTETEYAFGMLKGFLGHDDAGRVSRDDLARWRDKSLDAGLNNNTWNNRLSLIRQPFEQAVSDKKLQANPAENTLRLRKSRQQSPRPYSHEDAARILIAARREKRPSLRWAHWVMAFTGMRAGEVLQLIGRDVRHEDDLWFLDVNEDDPTKSVKTSERRHVPLHSALIHEGFLAYAQTIAPDAPLFPDKRLDRHGKRGGGAWNVIGEWARQRAGISDPSKAPDHSWRHRVEDELRAYEVPEDVRDALLGHGRKTTGRQYGVRGEALSRLARYLERIPLPPGVNPGPYAA